MSSGGHVMVHCSDRIIDRKLAYFWAQGEQHLGLAQGQGSGKGCRGALLDGTGFGGVVTGRELGYRSINHSRELPHLNGIS